MLNVEFLPNGLKGASLIQHSTLNIQFNIFISWEKIIKQKKKK